MKPTYQQKKKGDHHKSEQSDSGSIHCLSKYSLLLLPSPVPVIPKLRSCTVTLTLLAPFVAHSATWDQAEINHSLY